MDVQQIAALANQRRADAITMIHRCNTGHTGGTLSSLDIISTLYYGVLGVTPENIAAPDRNRFLLSKGHSVEGYLTVLADLGFFPKKELNTFSQAGSRLIGHPTIAVPGVEMCTGALGHALSIGVGMALGAKRQRLGYTTYVLLGDGELAEGSVWEAATAGAHYGLDNLVAIIDRNGLQISGATEDVMAHGRLHEKWRDFGWETSEADGHDVAALLSYFTTRKRNGKPHCLIAHTVKGKGLPVAENQAGWHHRVPTLEEVRLGYEALGVKGVEW